MHVWKYVLLLAFVCVKCVLKSSYADNSISLWILYHVRVHIESVIEKVTRFSRSVVVLLLLEDDEVLKHNVWLKLEKNHLRIVLTIMIADANAMAFPVGDMSIGTVMSI